MKTYAGIGSRGISPAEREQIVRVASYLKGKYTLYSGHAEGADEAFEEGADGDAVIWLPFADFRAEIPVKGKCYVMGKSANGEQATDRFHMHAALMKYGTRCMMNRNYHQIFGMMPDWPKVEFVVCCATPGLDNGEDERTFLIREFGERGPDMVANSVKGGTGQAVRIATHFNVPIFNTRTLGWKERLLKFLSTATA